jgi:hypothetical protein
MYCKMRNQKAFFIVVIIYFSIPVFAQKKNNVISTYYKDGIGMNAFMQLTLANDFTFIEQTRVISSVDRRIATGTVRGTYAIEQNRLILTPKESLSYDFRGNYTKLEETDSILKKTLFASEYEVVRYKNSILLFDDKIQTPGTYTNDFIDVANAINSKEESATDYIWRDSEQPITIKKDIARSFPAPWNEYILNKSVIAKVINSKAVQEGDEDSDKLKFHYPYADNIYMLDVGQNKGVYNGMKLYALEKDSVLCELTVFDVGSDQSKGYLLSHQEKDCKMSKRYSTKSQ